MRSRNINSQPHLPINAHEHDRTDQPATRDLLGQVYQLNQMQRVRVCYQLLNHIALANHTRRWLADA